MKNIIILGSTGSIGTQTLEVIDFLKSDWNVMGLSAHDSVDKLIEQCKKYEPGFVAISNKNHARKLEESLQNLSTEVLVGPEGLEEIAALDDVDLIVNAIVGAAGLIPSIAALKAGNQLGLANKESMVIGGSIIKKLLRKNQQKILPIDSEHNAIFQIADKHQPEEINKIILTASGGPFYDYPAKQLKNVSVNEALKHPNWEMGNKITIDSATLMNKGLEVIEAHWLFDMPYDKIEVVIHPESIVHSMVEMVDHSIMAELGVSDMKIPIQNVITYPHRKQGIGDHLDLWSLGQLHFSAPDMNKFPALKLAYEAGKEGGSMPVALNAANEIAVAAFLKRQISFTMIPAIIEKILTRHHRLDELSLPAILQVDREIREKTREVLNNVSDHN